MTTARDDSGPEALQAAPTRIVTAPDGRELAVCEWGDPAGEAVFALHGTPGSRWTRHHDLSAYADAGARVITYDRPGYGRSTRHPGRDVAAAAADVATIAEALDVDRFGVTGASGGGPHALAVAALLGERVERAASVVSIAPYRAEGLDFLAGMTQGNVDEFTWAQQGESVLYERMGPLCREILAGIEQGTGLGDAYELSEDDRAALADPVRRAVSLQGTREAFAAGIWGLVDDDIAFTRPWGFDVGSIAVPTQVWYGPADTLVPPQHGRWLAAHVPGAVEVLPGGHLSLDERTGELFGWLTGRQG